MTSGCSVEAAPEYASRFRQGLNYRKPQSNYTLESIEEQRYCLTYRIYESFASSNNGFSAVRTMGATMAFENIQWTWMNGEFVPWAESTVPLSTHALHYGTGVFEGIRSYVANGEPAIFRLDAHLERFYQSATVYGMRIPFRREQLAEAICGLDRKNRLTEAYIR